MALMVLVPPTRFVLVTEASPFVGKGICARRFDPCQKETRPVGLLPEGRLAETAAVKVTEAPDEGAEVRVMVVALEWIFCMSVTLPPGKTVSPLYAAVMKWEPR